MTSAMTSTSSTPRLPRPQPTRPRLKERFAQLGTTIRVASAIAGLWALIFGPARLFVRRVRRRLGAEGKLWLDDFGPFTGEPASGEQGDELFELEAARPRAPRKSSVMKVEAYPEPRYPFAYRRPPRSGNTTNGVGEAVRRRARKVFHTADFKHPLGNLELWFRLGQEMPSMNAVLRHRWQTRRQEGPVSQRRWPVDDPADAATRVKNEARALGAVAVGITKLEETDLFEGDEPLGYETAISIAVPMCREEMLYPTTARTLVAVMDGYRDVARVASDLAEHIRGLGWRASACTDMHSSKLLHIPVAVRAGLGQLGKHGSLITLDHGSNVRLSTVLTDMPLALDQPRDIGVDDFCLRCQICTDNCPPGAISPNKQIVRGEDKWYVDFDKCIPYFIEYKTCGICLEVCPWSSEGRGSLISAKALARRKRDQPTPVAS